MDAHVVFTVFRGRRIRESYFWVLVRWQSLVRRMLQHYERAGGRVWVLYIAHGCAMVRSRNGATWLCNCWKHLVREILIRHREAGERMLGRS